MMYKQLTSEQRYVISANPAYAQRQATARKQRMCKPRTYTQEVKQEVKQEVHKLLIQEQWSPQQISGYFKRIGKVTVSHETIYADIRWDKICGGTLWKYCRHKLKHRKKTLNKTLPILNRISIDQRPPEVDGKRFGDWEMDTIVRPNNKGAIVRLPSYCP